MKIKFNDNAGLNWVEIALPQVERIKTVADNTILTHKEHTLKTSDIPADLMQRIGTDILDGIKSDIEIMVDTDAEFNYSTYHDLEMTRETFDNVVTGYDVRILSYDGGKNFGMLVVAIFDQSKIEADRRNVLNHLLFDSTLLEVKYDVYYQVELTDAEIAKLFITGGD